MNGTRMKSIHYNTVAAAIADWMKANELKTKHRSILMAASCFNWEVFLAAKVEGNSIIFMTKNLMPYLNDTDIVRALMSMTEVDGTGYFGSGVKYSEICHR